MQQTDHLPENIKKGLSDFVAAAQDAFGNDLLSATLFGTAAEGKLRPTSDVNLILILKRFDRQAADKICEPLRMARATILLEAMFILESEIHLASEVFAVKFSDIESRHKVILGKDYFANLEIPTTALKLRLRQVLTNQILRLREMYVLTSLREEQLAKIIADAAGPLRSAATSLLKLQGRSAENPKEALILIVRENLKDSKWDEVLAGITKARDGVPLQPGKAQRIFFPILELAEFMLNEVNKLSA